jgi:inorganic pyrophosphatase
MQYAFKSHPWHGVAPRTHDPQVFNVYLELVPTDTVKYEIDKATGHLKVDRPQKYSSLCPTLYGFIPRTFCGERVAQICRDATRRQTIEGDGDPLDICVFSEKPISHADILVGAIPIGGLRMIDKRQADDKIIAVLKGDLEYGSWRTIHDMPQGILDRLRHYFLTYKQLPEPPSQQPGKPSEPPPQTVEITHVYDRAEALAVIQASLEDYAEKYGNPEETLIQFLTYLTEHVRRKEE